MLVNLPSLSVITPAYNAAEFLDDALLSVARQKEVRAEHIVVDGGSTDRTLEVLRRYPYMRWISEPDRGQSDAINKGFLRATCDLVGWLNADDYYLPGALQTIASAAREHPEADVIYGDCVFVDECGSVLRSKVEHEFDPYVLINFGCYIPSTSTFFRRRLIDSGFFLDCDYRVCMDFEYFARLAKAGKKFHYVPKFIAAFRWHGSNVSLCQQPRRAEERRLVQRAFAETSWSEDSLRYRMLLGRGKRLLRKLWSGNIEREFRVRATIGRSTRWLDSLDGLETCTKLASL